MFAIGKECWQDYNTMTTTLRFRLDSTQSFAPNMNCCAYLTLIVQGILAPSSHRHTKYDVPVCNRMKESGLYKLNSFYLALKQKSSRVSGSRLHFVLEESQTSPHHLPHKNDVRRQKLLPWPFA